MFVQRPPLHRLPLIVPRVGMPVADTPMVRAAAFPALSLANVHTCSQSSQEQREPLRVRRPSKARHEIAIPNGPVRWRVDVLAAREAHFRRTGRIARYPPTADHIRGRQDLDRMADGRNRLVLGRKLSNESDDARVKPEVFWRTTAREHQRIVVLRIGISKGRIQSEGVPWLFGVGLIALEV